MDRWVGAGRMSDVMARALAAGITMSEGRGQVALAAGWEERSQTGKPFIGLQSNGEALAPDGWAMATSESL